ncbi:histidine triad (HIT) protein [Catellatospora sp. NPDC049133]|jgi:diadenosine tetraphosphate (Ap4A) HIT family hydrolase|uniref:HIT family protein n=1 Tax=Catellatospora sp. NPDC049133 TaxID=3155499 RepID=UPI0033F7B75B
MVLAGRPQLDCMICDKHRGDGPLAGPTVWEDEHLVISHRPAGEDGTTVLGYLYVESRRHVPYLADLTDSEAEAIGRAVRRAALGLRTELSADFVFSAIAGMSHAHFHQHVFVRHTGTPAEYGWMSGDQWHDAPRGTAAAVVGLCSRLRPYLDEGSAPERTS